LPSSNTQPPAYRCPGSRTTEISGDSWNPLALPIGTSPLSHTSSQSFGVVSSNRTNVIPSSPSAGVNCRCGARVTSRTFATTSTTSSL
jgi:hypothetical protein